MSKPTVLAIMDDIIAWLEANDIDYKLVPLHEIPRVADGLITVAQYVRTEGGLVLDPTTDELKQQTIAVPLLVKPPAVLADWLAGKVPVFNR